MTKFCEASPSGNLVSVCAGSNCRLAAFLITPEHNVLLSRDRGSQWHLDSAAQGTVFRCIGYCKVCIGFHPIGILLIYSFNFQAFVDSRGPGSTGANYAEDFLSSA